MTAPVRDTFCSYCGARETSERGLVSGPAGLDDVFASSLHVEAARRYFVACGRGDRTHGFTAR